MTLGVTMGNEILYEIYKKEMQLMESKLNQHAALQSGDFKSLHFIYRYIKRGITNV